MSKFRGQTATLEIDGVTVAVLQNAELNPTRETQELTGQSIKREDIMQTSFRTGVSAEYASWDISGLKDILGYDDTNDQIEDTPEVPQFTVTGNFVSIDGTIDEDLAVQNVVFEDITLEWDGDSHVTKNLNGEGDDIVFTDNTA
jgi:hypothetical protein